ncbi:hypothetical protein KKH13_05080 [Patescibacteria group bacterium]|nr:hypothetical protein [Patescibacteria group bacterium]
MTTEAERIAKEIVKKVAASHRTPIGKDYPIDYTLRYEIANALTLAHKERDEAVKRVEQAKKALEVANAESAWADSDGRKVESELSEAKKQSTEWEVALEVKDKELQEAKREIEKWMQSCAKAMDDIESLRSQNSTLKAEIDQLNLKRE